MAGKSRLSEQESGFKTAERKGIRLSGSLNPGSAQPSQPASKQRRQQRGADTVRKQKVERAAARMEERHDRKLRGTKATASQLDVPPEKRLWKGEEVWVWLRPLSAAFLRDVEKETTLLSQS